MKIELKPIQERLDVRLQSDQCVLELEEPENSILLELVPSLSLKVPDTTDYLMYYNLSKG